MADQCLLARHILPLSVSPTDIMITSLMVDINEISFRFDITFCIQLTEVIRLLVSQLRSSKSHLIRIFPGFVLKIHIQRLLITFDV